MTEKKANSIFQYLLVLAGLVMLAAAGLSAGDVKIIANRSIKADSISAAELRGVYLLERTTLRDGSAAVPVLQKAGPVNEQFLRYYLDRGSAEIRTYYQGLVFTGKASMPKELNSDVEVVDYVARTKGAIGYVSSTAPTEGVRILSLASDQPRSERALLKRVEPEYPSTLRDHGISGTVRLELTIAPSGAVENVTVLGGNPILAEAAEKAARQWVYAAAPTRATLQVTIPFVAHR
jgi:TonB family protein